MPEYVDRVDSEMIFRIADPIIAITTSMQTHRNMMMRRIDRDAKCGCM